VLLSCGDSAMLAAPCTVACAGHLPVIAPCCKPNFRLSLLLLLLPPTCSQALCRLTSPAVQRRILECQHCQLYCWQQLLNPLHS
jgi:hypothetical protein